MEKILTTYKDKIVVIGVGSVGEAIAYTLMVRSQANDIVLIDLDEGRAKGAALDIAHGTSFYKHIWVRSGGYEECADANIIIIAAGIARKWGQTRLELAKDNVAIVQDITKKIMNYAKNPLILIVSNPVDITTLAVQKTSGLLPERVIGSGTSLDTARFRYMLSKKLQVNVEDIKAYVIGEHGDSQVPVFSSAHIGGFPLKDLAQQMGIELDENKMAKRTKNSGAEVIGLKGATFYGIAMAVSNIVESIMKDDCAIIPVSHVLDERFEEWEGIAISLPCQISRMGIKQTFHIPMNSYEQRMMDESVVQMKQFIKKLGLFDLKLNKK